MATAEILNQSETVEWYTPKRFTDAARIVLGSIELDPASCDEANRTVRALRYFSMEDDGLAHQWKARTVFLNPPYGKDEFKRRKDA